MSEMLRTVIRAGGLTLAMAVLAWVVTHPQPGQPLSLGRKLLAAFMILVGLANIFFVFYPE